MLPPSSRTTFSRAITDEKNLFKLFVATSHTERQTEIGGLGAISNGFRAEGLAESPPLRYHQFVSGSRRANHHLRNICCHKGWAAAEEACLHRLKHIKQRRRQNHVRHQTNHPRSSMSTHSFPAIRLLGILHTKLAVFNLCVNPFPINESCSLFLEIIVPYELPSSLIKIFIK